MHFIRVALVTTAILMSSQGAYAAQQAGVAGGIVGASQVSGAERQNTLPITSGMDMLLNDRVQSTAASRLQILLLDETVLTVGPNSDLVIDKFVFDPAAQTGEMTASFVKGALRYISGNIARANPAGVVIKTNTATIGVRGTALFVTDDPESPGTQFIGLLGPGDKNDGDMKVGGLSVSNAVGTTEVFRAGYGVFVSPGSAPGPAVQSPLRLVQHVQQQMTVTISPPEPQSEQKSGQGANSGPGRRSEDGAAPGRAFAAWPEASAPPGSPPPSPFNSSPAGEPPLPPSAPTNFAGGNLAVTRQLSAGAGDILGTLGVASRRGSNASQDMVVGSQGNVSLRPGVTLVNNPDSIVLSPASRTLTVTTSNALTGVTTTTSMSPTRTTTTTVTPARTTTTVEPARTTTTTVEPTRTTTTTLEPARTTTTTLEPTRTTATTLEPARTTTATVLPTSTITTTTPTTTPRTTTTTTATTTPRTTTTTTATTAPRTTTTTATATRR